MFNSFDQDAAIGEIQLNFVEFQRWRFRSLHLTDRQLECLAWVQEGKSSADIGVILGISPRTVENHLFKICERLGVRTRLQAVVKACELGLIGPGNPMPRPAEGRSA